jgi:pyrroloquinoline quinone biosynthesis protein B
MSPSRITAASSAMTTRMDRDAFMLTCPVHVVAARRPGPGHRRTPVAGVILTDAELDHTLGLLRLREARNLQILAPPAVLGALSDGLRLDRVLGAYTGLDWSELYEDRPVRLGDLEVRGIAMSDKRPRYAAGLDHSGPWVMALRITDRAAGTAVVYAPCLAGWPAELDDALRDADCVFADGTFWDDEEPRRSGISAGTAGEMGHLPITETAERLAASPAARRFYTHLNNTNPLVDPNAPQHRTLAGMGIEVAREKAVIEL